MLFRTRLLALVLGSILFPGVLTANAETPKARLVIGGIFDLSSQAAKLWGTAEKNGTLMAIADFNAKHPNMQAELIVEDSQYSNAKSVSAFHKLTSIDRANFIIGPTWEVFTAIMPLCETKKIICFAPTHNGSEFHQTKRKYEHAFSAWFDERGYADVVLADLKSKGFKRIGVVGAISEYHITLLDQLIDSLPAPAEFDVRLPYDTTDFRAVIGKIPANLDALIIFITGDSMVTNFLRQWFELRRDKPVFYGDDNFLYLPQESNDQIKGLKAEIFYSVPYMDPELERKFGEKYAARFGHKPEAPGAAVAYDEASILLNCAARDASTEAVRKCIASTSNYPGMSGTISFNGQQTVSTRRFRLEKFSVKLQ